jgi:spoIIIJ-associated protein
MEKTVIKTGKTDDEAIEAALSELGCTKEQATIEVVEEGTEGGFLGLGRKDAEVKVTFNSEETAEAAAPTASDDTYYGDDESLKAMQ